MEKTVLTGIKPTGRLHLGNYIGAISPSVELSLQENVRSLFFIADCHSLTSVSSPEELRRFVRQAASSWLACGLDPDKTVLYLQSDIPELTELSWILSCVTPKGLLNRAHSYKALRQKNQELGGRDLDDGVSMGLYSYPVLMAADILLFLADEVPVGGDQRQHLEMARDIARKFNRIYKTNLFRLPKTLTRKSDLLPGIDGRKMSKSHKNEIPLFCSSKELRGLVMKIKTDSLPPEQPKNPENSLIFEIYKSFSAKEEIDSLRRSYLKGIGYGEAKEILFEKLDGFFKNKREVYNYYMEENGALEKILKRGKEKALALSRPFMEKVRAVVGVR